MIATLIRNYTEKYLDEWIEGSGVSRAIAQLNLVNIDDPKEIAKLLNWKGYSHTAGWYVRSVDIETGQLRNFGQFKPTEPIQFPNSDKPQKYFSFPKGDESEAIFLSVDKLTWKLVSAGVGVPINPDDIDESRLDLGFWKWVKNHPEIPITLTEGAKKAACLLSRGCVGVALTGVWNGQSQKRKLAPTLAPIIMPGRPVYLCFDADVVVKPQVQNALQFMGYLLTKSKTIVSVIVWELSKGKGIDDFAVSQQQEEFEQLMSNGTPYSEWLKSVEKQFKSNSVKKEKLEKLPKSSIIAKKIAELCQERLAWNIETQSWFRYQAQQPGIWSMEPDECIEQVVSAELEILDKCGEGWTYSYLTDVIKLMRSQLLIRTWNQTRGLIPLQNGVLNKKAKVLEPHSPVYRLTYCLPFKYNPLATCDPIVAWLQESVERKEDVVELLLAYLNAVVNQRADLHRFLELVGASGTGKSTYIRLAESLVGSDNTRSTNLRELEESRFETANLYGKLLTVITDSDRYGGSASILKALTGGDTLRYEVKMKQASPGFKFEGMVLIAANESPQSTDYTSGLARRRLSVPFRNHVPSHKRRDLDKEFQPYLPGLLNAVLAISDERVTQLIRDTDRHCPSLRQYQREKLCETNSIADWLDRRLIRQPGYKLAPSLFYKDYKSYCIKSGEQSVSLKRFSNLLLDLCRIQLGWYDVDLTKVGHFEGLRIRLDYDCMTPLAITEALDLGNGELEVGNEEEKQWQIPKSQLLSKESEKEAQFSQERDLQISPVSLRSQCNEVSHGSDATTIVDLAVANQQHFLASAEKKTLDSEPRTPDFDRDHNANILNQKVTLKYLSSEEVKNPSQSVATIAPQPVQTTLAPKRQRIKIGDKCRYIGDRLHYSKHYSGLMLIAEIFQDGAIACRLPDGLLSTWLKPSELEIWK